MAQVAVMFAKPILGQRLLCLFADLIVGQIYFCDICRSDSCWDNNQIITGQGKVQHRKEKGAYI